MSNYSKGNTPLCPVFVTAGHGKVIDCTEDFLRLTKYDKDRLYTLNLQDLMHEDMIQQALDAFKGVTSSGKPWNGVMVFKCGDGTEGWYEVCAIPIMDGNAVQEVHYICLQPSAELSQRVQNHYRGFRLGRATNYKADKLKTIDRIAIANIAPTTAWVLSSVLLNFPTVLFLAGLAGSAVLGWLFSRWCCRDFNELLDFSNKFEISANKIHAFIGRLNDIARMQFVLHMIKTEKDSLLISMLDAATKVEVSANNTVNKMQRCVQDMSTQQNDLREAVAGIERFNQLSSDLNHISNQSLEESNGVLNTVEQGSQRVQQSINTIEQLANMISNSSHLVSTLEERSTSIAQFMDVIQSIAEQTNLLALNAAIEAARAGENGRGFAVVADEVRNLATRTQESASEIQSLINAVQTEIGRTVSSLQQELKMSDDCVKDISEAGEMLTGIGASMQGMHQMAIKIADSTQLQNQETSALTTRIQDINQSVNKVVAEANETQEMNLKTVDVARKQAYIVSKILQK